MSSHKSSSGSVVLTFALGLTVYFKYGNIAKLIYRR